MILATTWHELMTHTGLGTTASFTLACIVAGVLVYRVGSGRR